MVFCFFTHTLQKMPPACCSVSTSSLIKEALCWRKTKGTESLCNIVPFRRFSLKGALVIDWDGEYRRRVALGELMERQKWLFLQLRENRKQEWREVQDMNIRRLRLEPHQRLQINRAPFSSASYMKPERLCILNGEKHPQSFSNNQKQPATL